MMTKMIKYTLAILILFSVSCIEEIDLTVPGDLTDSVAIQGRIVQGESSYVEVSVSNVFDFTTDSRTAVVVKSVKLIDEDNNSMDILAVDVGEYGATLDETTSIQATIGMAYKIEVVTLDNRTFESRFDVLDEVIESESISLGFVDKLVIDNLDNYVTEEKLQLRVSTPIDITKKGGILWEVENIFQITDTPTDNRIQMKTCYVTEPIGRDRVTVLDPSELTVGRVDDLELFTTDINFKFGEGLYFIVNQYSLSEAAFEYWQQVKTLTERTGNMFDDPVGEVTSNISNVTDPSDRVFGFFFATSVDSKRIRVTEEFTGPVSPYCPPVVNNPPPFGCPFGICCDCLAEPQSTTIRPDFWEE